MTTTVNGQCTLPWGTFNGDRNGNTRVSREPSSEKLTADYEDLSYKNLEDQGELWLPIRQEAKYSKGLMTRRILLVLVTVAAIVGISWAVMSAVGESDLDVDAYAAEDDSISTGFFGHRQSDSVTSEDPEESDEGHAGGGHYDHTDESLWKEIMALEMFEYVRHEVMHGGEGQNLDENGENKEGEDEEGGQHKIAKVIALAELKEKRDAKLQKQEEMRERRKIFWAEFAKAIEYDCDQSYKNREIPDDDDSGVVICWDRAQEILREIDHFKKEAKELAKFANGALSHSNYARKSTKQEALRMEIVRKWNEADPEDKEEDKEGESKA